MGATSTIQKYLMCYFVPVWSNWHIGQHSLPVRTKYENRWLLVFTLPLDGITCVSWINTINPYNATRWVQQVPANVRNVVICSCLEQLTHWASRTTCKNQVWEQMYFSFYRCILVFTLPLDGITCVSWTNTINQYNARRWVQPVPDTCT